MPPRFLRVRWKDPLIFMIGALLCAAALVIYLQQRALTALDRQTAVIFQQVLEQSTNEVLDSIRRRFDGPVFDTLSSTKHPHLVENRIDLVAPAFASGLIDYPQVERFFVWTGADAGEGDLLFYDRSRVPQVEQAGGPYHRFYRDAKAGHIIREVAHRYARSQMIYGAFQTEIDGVPYDVFLRTFYTDAARTRFFAVLGFMVNLDKVRQDLFRNLLADGLGKMLQPPAGGPAFEMRVHDEQGRLVFGPAAPVPSISVRRPFSLIFYPAEDILPRMAAALPEREWTLTLSQQEGVTPALIAYARWQTYWLGGVSVLLICVALGFALQARARAAQLARMQTDFVAHVSHQLKTPVSLLSAVGETMELVRTRSPEKLDQCLDIVKVETARLSALVQHILEFSSVSDGERRFELEPVALGALVRETAESFAAALAPTGFRIHVEERAAPIVAADPVALEQAVVNLLDNAIKYSANSRHVTVRLSADASYAAIEIIDHGIGISPRDQSRIFERFYRGSGESASRQGFGLGLAIAQQLVAGQRGSIEVESTVGVGSTFRIKLPVVHAAEQSTSPAARRWFGRTPVGAPGRETA